MHRFGTKWLAPLLGICVLAWSASSYAQAAAPVGAASDAAQAAAIATISDAPAPPAVVAPPVTPPPPPPSKPGLVGQDTINGADTAWMMTSTALVLLMTLPGIALFYGGMVRSLDRNIGRVLDDEGIMNPPDILRLALRDSDPITRVQTEFSDDPEMFGAIYKFEDDKRANIETYTRTCLQLLSDQLTQLPLQSGDTADVIQRLVRSIR